ncbi:hypothetical protein M426DRAFT_15820 [Hypoxylon sp. CI-4A]|nr:hypothetical protein M426DRAFT_15820 [Hypoxylon sp. CI-4A]
MRGEAEPEPEEALPQVLPSLDPGLPSSPSARIGLAAMGIETPPGTPEPEPEPEPEPATEAPQPKDKKKWSKRNIWSSLRNFGRRYKNQIREHTNTNTNTNAAAAAAAADTTSTSLGGILVTQEVSVTYERLPKSYSTTITSSGPAAGAGNNNNNNNSFFSSAAAADYDQTLDTISELPGAADSGHTESGNNGGGGGGSSSSRRGGGGMRATAGQGLSKLVRSASAVLPPRMRSLQRLDRGDVSMM